MALHMVDSVSKELFFLKPVFPNPSLPLNFALVLNNHIGYKKISVSDTFPN